MSEAEAALPEQGTLEGLALARVLLALHARRWSGTVELARGRALRRLELAEGHPVYAESSLRSEGLVRHLVEQGTLAEEDAARASELRERRGGRELAAVAALRRLAPKELVAAVRGYLRSQLHDVLGWRDGRYCLDAEAAPADGTEPFRVDPRPHVVAALARGRRPDELLAALGERVQAFPEPAEGLERLERRLELPEEARSALASLDGSRDVWSWVAGGAPASALAALFVLGELGALRFRSEPPRAAEAEPEEAEGEAEPAAPPEIEIAVAGAGAEAGAAARSEASGSGGGAAPRAAASEGGEADREAALRAEVEDLHARLDELTLYEVLGVERDARRADVKRAYVRAAKRLHPDALARLGLDDLKAQANAVFARVGRAHAVLSDPKEREAYDAELAGESQADAERVARAEGLFRKGELMLRAGSFAESLAFLEPAAETCPEEPDYRSALGWALFKKNPPEPERARAELETAIEAQPESAVHLLRLGMVLRGSGERERGDPLVAKARKIDPNVRP